MVSFSKGPGLSVDDIESMGAFAQFYGRDDSIAVTSTLPEENDARPASAARGDVASLVKKAYRDIFRMIGDHPSASIIREPTMHERLKFVGRPGFASGEDIASFAIPFDSVRTTQQEMLWGTMLAQRVPKQIMTTMIQDMVWTRPRCPNKKLHGRKGTRKDWKRRNPPAYRAQGEPRQVEFISTIDGVVYLTDELRAQVKQAQNHHRALNIEHQDHFGIDLLKIYWERMAPVEVIERGANGRRASRLDFDTYTEVETRYAASLEEVHQTMRRFWDGELDR